MIKIAVVSYNNEAPEEPLSAIFGQERNTLGRSRNNFFVLPDTKHYVSRLQAAVWSDGTRHTLVNLSQANPILINGREIDPELDTNLMIGDEIHIGPYLLRAESPTAANEDHATPSNNVPLTEPLQPLDTTLSLKELPQTEMLAALVEESANSVEEAGASNADTPALLQAFLNGAGIPAGSITAGLTPELMEMIGKLLVKSLQGAIELNALRTLVKREAKAELTMVVLRNNNPLKFFPDSQTVLTQMLRKKMPGFMGPLEAIDDAFEDLRAHQIGVVAGTRAAMQTMLRRLNPDNFEKQLPESTFMDTIVPSKRKAAAWEIYASQFNKVAADSKDDFKTLFGKEFLVAYEKEIDRFKDGLHDD